MRVEGDEAKKRGKGYGIRGRAMSGRSFPGTGLDVGLTAADTTPYSAAAHCATHPHGATRCPMHSPPRSAQRHDHSSTTTARKTRLAAYCAPPARRRPPGHSTHGALEPSCTGTMFAVHCGSPLIGPTFPYDEWSKTMPPGPSLMRQYPTSPRSVPVSTFRMLSRT